ncbi:hypothetical protein [Planctomicrobium sp. SH527]|uniref:hypothetical protein n=1 Tax=Planctomicrobium sp. SH527 TaxID=3448123 RepID=UPI003F5B5302
MADSIVVTSCSPKDVSRWISQEAIASLPDAEWQGLPLDEIWKRLCALPHDQFVFKFDCFWGCDLYELKKAKRYEEFVQSIIFGSAKIHCETDLALISPEHVVQVACDYFVEELGEGIEAVNKAGNLIIRSFHLLDYDTGIFKRFRFPFDLKSILLLFLSGFYLLAILSVGFLSLFWHIPIVFSVSVMCLLLVATLLTLYAANLYYWSDLHQRHIFISHKAELVRLVVSLLESRGGASGTR